MWALEVLAKAIQAHDQRFDALEEKLDKLLDHFGLR